MREKIGHGVFMWMSPERRTNRYGAFFLSDTTYDEERVATPSLAFDTSRHLGRMRVTAVVVASRESGHCGDHALGIKPAMPEIGEEVPLGVANLGLDMDGDIATLVMRPDDDRDELWMDPRALYRLHDQTVDIYVERTDDPCSPPPDLAPAAVGTFGNGDGSFQCKKAPLPTRLPPRVTSLGEGLFMMDFDYAEGARIGADDEA